MESIELSKNIRDIIFIIPNLKNKNQVRSHIAPSQIELKVIITDIDGYMTEKNVIFELPLKS